MLDVKWLYRSFTSHPITRSLISWYFLAALLYKYWNPGHLISKQCCTKPHVDKHYLVCYSTGRLSLIFLQQAQHHSDRRLPFTSGYALRLKHCDKMAGTLMQSLSIYSYDMSQLLHLDAQHIETESGYCWSNKQWATICWGNGWATSKW